MKPGAAPDRPFRRQRRVLAASLPKALEGDVEAVHRARVTTRRLREALTILDGTLSAGSAQKHRRRLRRVTRALGPVRELDVADGLLARLEQNATEHARVIGKVRRWIRRERSARRRAMRSRLSSKLERLREALATVAQRIPGPDGSTRWREGLATRIRELGTRTNESVARAGAMYVSERVHQVRIRLKKLRYALEFARESGAARTTLLVRRLKAAQDTLGQLHDLEVVLLEVRTFAARVKPRDGWDQALEDFARDLENECRRLHARYVTKQAQIVRLCADAQDVARRLAPARQHRSARSRAVLKMSLNGSASRPARVSAG